MTKINKVYTVVIEKPCRIVREFSKQETVTEVIEKIFGSEKANDVSDWIGTTFTDSTYRDNEFYIHCLCNV